jgi:hypothetical protein
MIKLNFRWGAAFTSQRYGTNLLELTARRYRGGLYAYLLDTDQRFGAIRTECRSELRGCHKWYNGTKFTSCVRDKSPRRSVKCWKEAE